MMDVCDTFKVEIGALCFDGLMVYKTSVKDLPELLSSMETCIHEKMGIELNIVQKDMDEIIDLTGFPTGLTEQPTLKCAKSAEVSLLKSCFTDGDIADYFFSLYKDIFKYYHNNLYKFNGVYWKKSLTNELYSCFDFIYFDLLNVLNTYWRGVDDKEFYDSAIKKLLKLRNNRSCEGVVRYVIRRIEIDEDVWDRDIDLLGFTNGTYDLKSDSFRNGLSSDYITRVVPHDYKVSNEGDKEKMMEFIKQVMPVDDEREFFLKTLATGLRGATLEKFIVCTGNGRNGKDTLLTYLYKGLIGEDLCYESNITAITQLLKGDLNASIAGMHRKRVVMYNEPTKAETVKVSIVKTLTGGKHISVRNLYQSETKCELAATNIMICNEKPLLDCVDDAIAQRLIVFEFRAMFRDEQALADLPEGTLYAYPVNPYYKSEEFINSMRMPFLSILLDYFIKFRDDNYILKSMPESIRDLAKDYLSESDEFYGWFITAYERTQDDGDYVQIKDVFNEFRMSEYYRDLNKAARRKCTLKWLTNEVCKNINLKGFYKERHQPYVNGKQVCCRNVILKYKFIQDEVLVE